MDFGLGERPQTEKSGASGEGLADGWDGEEVRRTREQESSRSRIQIHDLFERPHEPVSADLDLIDDEWMAMIE